MRQLYFREKGDDLLPRQTRRGRSGSQRRRSEPSLPLHLYQRHEPDEETAPEIARDDAAETGVLTLDAAPPPVPSSPLPRTHAVPVVPAVRPAPVPQQDRASAANRLRFTDYGYVIPELRRIFAVAGTVVVLLIIIAIVHG